MYDKLGHSQGCPGGLHAIQHIADIVRSSSSLLFLDDKGSVTEPSRNFWC